ncbi:J domain-containing protein [Lentisphaerota bacterium WC36G]|nr:J domain-containing protein [Lentisphaerae bacterium WC36]
MNYYQILNVKNDCDFATLKKAYFKQAKLCHPDLFAGDKNKEEEFKKLVNAFDVISDPVKRACYDQQLITTVLTQETEENTEFNNQDFVLNTKSIMDSIADDILEELIVGNNIDVDKSSLATLLTDLEQTETFIMYREAKNLFFNYEYKKAGCLFKKLAKKTPQNILYHYYLGQSYACQHNFIRAVGQFRTALKLGKLRIPTQQLYRIKHELSDLIKKQNFLIRTMLKLSEPIEKNAVGNFEADKILITETEKSMNRIMRKNARLKRLENNKRQKLQK